MAEYSEELAKYTDKIRATLVNRGQDVRIGDVMDLLPENLRDTRQARAFSEAMMSEAEAVSGRQADELIDVYEEAAREISGKKGLFNREFNGDERDFKNVLEKEQRQAGKATKDMELDPDANTKRKDRGVGKIEGYVDIINDITNNIQFRLAYGNDYLKQDRDGLSISRDPLRQQYVKLESKIDQTLAFDDENGKSDFEKGGGRGRYERANRRLDRILEKDWGGVKEALEGATTVPEATNIMNSFETALKTIDMTRSYIEELSKNVDDRGSFDKQQRKDFRQERREARRELKDYTRSLRKGDVEAVAGASREWMDLDVETLRRVEQDDDRRGGRADDDDVMSRREVRQAMKEMKEALKNDDDGYTKDDKAKVQKIKDDWKADRKSSRGRD